MWGLILSRVKWNLDTKYIQVEKASLELTIAVSAKLISKSYFYTCVYKLPGSVLCRARMTSARRFPIMAAEGCEEMSGNGQLEESPGSSITVNVFHL